MYKIHILIMQYSCGCNVPKIVQHKSEAETVRVIIPEPCPDCQWQETKKEWLYTAEEAVTKCNELARENAELRRFRDNGIACFAEPCDDHSGINTLPFDQFMAMYGGRCLACEVDRVAELEQENAKLVRLIEQMRRNNVRL